MDKTHPVLERLARGQPLVVDGGVAGELARRGYRPQGPLFDAVAAREVPDVVSASHLASIEAGADVIVAHTTRTTVRTLARGGVGMRAAALTHRAVDLALEAIARSARSVAVAGALGPLEENFAHPERSPSPRTLCDEHREQAVRLQSAGCQIVLIEAMPTLAETIAATAAARAVHTPVWATLRLGARARLHDGTPLETAAACVAAAGAQALLLEGPTPELSAAVALAAGLAAGVPLGARALRESDESATALDRSSAELMQALQRGARLVGCAPGTTSEHVRVLAAKVRARAAAA